MMTYRKGWTILLLLLCLLVPLAAGCSALPDQVQRSGDGTLLYTEGTNTWSWAQAKGVATIGLNDTAFATVRGREATVTLGDKRVVHVTLDQDNAPVSVSANWGVELSASDYTLMTQAFQFHKLAGGVKATIPWVGAIVLLVITLLFVLAAVFAGSLVDWAKMNGLFSSFNTGRMLFLFRALALLLAALFFILLLATLF